MIINKDYQFLDKLEKKQWKLEKNLQIYYLTPMFHSRLNEVCELKYKKYRKKYLKFMNTSSKSNEAFDYIKYLNQSRKKIENKYFNAFV